MTESFEKKNPDDGGHDDISLPALIGMFNNIINMSIFPGIGMYRHVLFDILAKFRMSCKYYYIYVYQSMYIIMYTLLHIHTNKI